jgi:hypothetical protein
MTESAPNYTSKLERGFSVFAERYDFDVKFTADNGWAQIDTWQDASYFGVWVNPFDRKIFTFCEGDKSLESCDTDEDFKAALRACLEFYDRGEGRRTMIDALFSDRLTARLTELGFVDRLH